MDYGYNEQAEERGQNTMIQDTFPTQLNQVSSLLRPQKPGDALPEDYEPTSLDVCSGRGKRNWNHAGNK
jgi:hypothetical protein